MNKVTTGLAVLTAAAVLSLGTANAENALEIQARLGIVHYDETDINTYYNYIAAIPAHVFHYQGNCYTSPLIADTTGDWVNYFHEDAAAYYNAEGGLKEIMAVGAVSDAVLNDLASKYGVSADHVIRLSASTPAEMAEKLARDWDHSDDAVLVPYAAAPTTDEYDGAANGAALAASLNAPLLFVDKNSVPEATLRALSRGGVKNVYLVEFGDFCGDAVNQQLTADGYVVSRDFVALGEFVLFMRERAGYSALMTYKEPLQSLPAALSAARHQGYCATLAVAVLDEARRAADTLVGVDMPTEKFPVGAWSPPPEYDSGEQALADAFVAWLDGINGSDPQQLEWVTYFGPKTGNGNAYINFDRAIIGNPLDPDQPGCKGGRLPGDVGQNIFYANRSILYRAVVFGNPHYDRSIVAFNAFACHYAEQGYKFTDNYGQGRCVNEVFGVPEFTEPGVAERFKTNNYTLIYDSGYNAGTYQGNNWHPINPSWHTLDGYFKYLNDGSNFFYYSGHGSTGAISSMASDMGCNETVPWGTEHWPSPAGIITDAPGTLNFSAWDAALENIHSTVITFDACLVAAGNWNESGLAHGGAGAISSYISVSWEGSGWCWCNIANEGTLAKPMGEAVAYGLGQTSHIYPQHKNGADGTLMYFWTGDPFMVLYQPTWTRPTPAPLYNDYGGHQPGGMVGVELTYFRARRLGDGARVDWATAEGAYAGFNLYRDGTSAAGGLVAAGREKINDKVIAGRSPYTFRDPAAGEFDSCRYWLEAVTAAGVKTLYGPVALGGAATPRGFALAQNYPNPVKGATTITYEVPAGKAGALALEFYDQAGRRVAHYDLGNAAAGTYKFQWNGATPEGSRLAAGVYLYRLTLDGARVAGRKLVVVR